MVNGVIDLSNWLLATFAGWLVGASLIGLAVGWITFSHEPRGRWSNGLAIAGALAFTAGLVVAALKLLPGRFGFWLEIALLMTFAYVIGCFLGGWLKRLLGGHDRPRPVARGSQGDEAKS